MHDRARNSTRVLAPTKVRTKGIAKPPRVGANCAGRHYSGIARYANPGRPAPIKLCANVNATGVQPPAISRICSNNRHIQTRPHLFGRNY